MGKTLQSSILKFSFWFCLVAFAAMPFASVGQTAGDVAFVGFNGDGNDDFAIVALEDIPANTIIHFTDRDWDGSAFTSPGDAFSWDSGSSLITAGTVITFNDINTSGRTVSEGSYSGGSAITLTVSTTVIYAYTGSDEDTPSTFLAAIATNTDNYDGTDGTLSGTGLNQGTTAILLSSNIDGAAYIGDRSGNTPNGYHTELNDIANNWDETDASGDGTMFLPFDTTPFTVVNPPTVAFTVSADTVAEDDFSATLEVELVESNDTEVSVEVVFLAESSEADISDLTDEFGDSYSTETVTFSSSASSGDTKDVNVPLNGDNDFEGDELAVFQLQNNDGGAIIEPDVLNLVISDNEGPSSVNINEFLADPPTDMTGDANGDGVTDSGDDEFIELLNRSNVDIDISGWQLSDDDGSTIRHIFPEGTVVPAGQAIVVFGGGNPEGNFGGAILQTASSGGLSLNNSGDDPNLLNAEGDKVSDLSYGSEGEDDQSLNRDPDGSNFGLSKHSNVSGSGGAAFSPGTQVDGTPWGEGTFAIGFRGTAGYRFVSTPAQNTSFDDLFGDLWTQGIPGSDANSGDDVTIFSWQEGGGGTFSPIGNMSDNLNAGQGYIIYVFEDDNFSAPGIQGGFPKTINTSEAENSSPVSVAVSAQDGPDGDSQITTSSNEGYNLLGNPYGTDVSVTAILDALETANPDVGATDPPNTNRNIAVWDHDGNSGNGSYEYLSDGDQLAPFQAFFMRYTSTLTSTTVDFNRNSLAANQGKQFYGRPPENTLQQEPISFEIRMGNGAKYDDYEVEFSENGTIGEDRYDAYKLFSLNANSINFFSTLGDGVRLAKNVLPTLGSLEEEGELRIPFEYDIPESGEYIFSWDDLSELPENVELKLVDNQTGRTVDLKTEEEFQVNLNIPQQTERESINSAQLIIPPTISSTAAASENDGPRFELIIESAAPEDEPDQTLEEPVVLSANYPNPFNAQTGTTMDLQLQERMHVEMSIYNIVGQKVETMIDRMMDANVTHNMTWNVPANMPSGIYICKVEASGTVITRKMTLVK